MKAAVLSSGDFRGNTNYKIKMPNGKIISVHASSTHLGSPTLTLDVCVTPARYEEWVGLAKEAIAEYNN